MNTIRLTTCLAVAALSATAWSQTPHFSNTTQKEIAAGSATTVSGDGKTVTIEADFTGDLRRDAVILNKDDGNLIFVYDINMMNAVFNVTQTTGTINDVCFVRADGPTSAARFMTVGSNGLTLYSNYDAGSFTQQSIGGSAWNNAQRVIPALFDGNTDSDFVGLSSNGLSVLVLNDAFTTGANTNQFPLLTAPYDIAVGNWTGTSTPEIIILQSFGLNIRKKRGNNLGNVLLSNSGGTITMFRQDGYSKKRAAVVYTSGTTQNLAVLDDSGFTESTIQLNANAYAAAAGDADDDGDDDLLVVSSDVDGCLLLDNLSDGVAPDGTATFSLAAADSEDVDFTTTTSTANANQTALPLFVDLDNDGDEDIAMYVEELDAFVLQRNSATDHMANIPMLEDPGPGGVTGDISTPPNETVTLTLDIDVTGLGGDGIQWQCWTKPMAGSSTDNVIWDYGYQEIDENVERIAFEIFGADAAETTDRDYYCIFQVVDEYTNGEPHEAYQAACIVVSLQYGQVQAIETSTGETAVILDCSIVDFDGTTCNAPPIPVYMAIAEGETPEQPEEREIGPGGICVPDVPPTELPPKPIKP